MSCIHEYYSSSQPDYEVCVRCGTYHSTASLSPKEIYEDNYWSEKWGHNTLKEHQHNVDVHTENGLTKNEFVLKQIAVQTHDAVLEIACFPGNLLRRLKQEIGFRLVVGIDVDACYFPDMREIAGREPVLVSGYFPDATKCFGYGMFDLIIGLDIFEHMHDPRAFLLECNRLLKKDGQLLLMVPIMSESFNPRFFHAREHVFLHSQKHMDELILETGFQNPIYDKWTEGHDTISTCK
jgi:2-polyprenyl-3-methyl-5-hydroxy-6-metoxy-1,4-benzoquinol methylase